MKKLTLLFTVFISLLTFLKAQEFADFSVIEPNKGTGNFTNGCLPNFTWEAIGTISEDIQILANEEFVDGNEFEKRFGQANNAENLRIQIYPNGAETKGTPILSKARLTINFDKATPSDAWGFCVVDIDVEHCLISAIDKFGNNLDKTIIDTWLVELFDADPGTDGLNIPKWDSAHAALLGSDTEPNYVVYDSLVIGGLPSSEAPAAFFMPNVSLKSLIIDFENLQQTHFTSFHFYIAADDDKTFVPDDNFEQALIDLGYDNGSLDDLVPTANINGITSLDVSSKNIADLTGIEDFTALKLLGCSFNEISELDVSKNVALEGLAVYSNNLTELDVSKNVALESLSVYSNNLSKIDVSSNPALNHFSISYNQLTEIDVSKNFALRSISCRNNSLNELNIANNPALEILYCGDNNLSELDVSKNTLLEYFSFNNNQLTTIDLSKNTALKVLDASGNQLSDLNVDTNIAIYELKCFNNQLTTLDLSNTLLLRDLFCQNNKISSLNLNNNTALFYLNCSNNQLVSFDLTNNTDLRYADCSMNLLESINLVEFRLFKYLDCSHNQLSTIDLLNNTGLGYLDCSNNQLSELDLSNIEDIFVVLCDSNNIVSLDVSLNDTLYLLDCSNNQLTELNIKNGNNSQLTGETTPLYPMYFDPDPMFKATNNPNLLCIQVDDVEASAGYIDWFKDDVAEYAENCTQSVAEDFLFKDELKIFPVPTQNKFKILRSNASPTAGGFKVEDAIIEIYDLNGKKLLEKQIPAGTENVEIDVSHLKGGVYICQLISGKEKTTKKFVKN